MESFWRDLRLGLRQLLEDKGFSIAAILTLTLGIAATATIFTVVNAVLLKELPYRDSGRLVMLQGSSQDKDKGEATVWPLSQMDFADWRKRSTVFSDTSLWGSFAFNLQQGPQSQRLWGELVNDSYFPMLGIKPARGRFFTPDEDARPLEQYVVVLGYNLWRNSFGGDPRVLGRKLQLNGKIFEVIGVAPRGFRGMSDQADLWVPSMLPPVINYLNTRTLRWASGVGRLKPGISVQQAQEQLNQVTAGLAQEFPNINKGMGAIVTPFDKYWLGDLRTGLLVLTVGACLLLLVACISVASLLLTRAVAKRRAWAIRLAMGASRLRLVRQLLTESILLSLIGACSGLLLAHWATRLLIAVSGAEFPSFVHVSMEPRVIVVIIGLATLCGIAFGLAPLWNTLRTDITRTLGRSEKMEASGRGWRWLQNTIVIAQVALTLPLTVDALLMAKSYRQLSSKSIGFRSDNLLTFRIDMREPKYFNDDAGLARLMSETYLPRISAVPGVQQAAIADPNMPTDPWSVAYLTVEDSASELPDGSYPAQIRSVTPAYFDMLGIPILNGRGFDMHDTMSYSVIVSKPFADRVWPGKDPIGKRLKLAARSRPEFPWVTVIGVAAEIRQEGLSTKEAPAPQIYLSLLQMIRRPFTANFLVRPKPGISMGELRRSMRREMFAIAPEFPEYDMATMEERLAYQTSRARFLVLLISIFAGLSLVLALVGIYGVTSYSVSQRTREIAIRMSLGAARRSILEMIVRRGAVLAVIGLALGLVAVFSLGWYLAPLLYQTKTTDPLILGGTSLVLFVVMLVANFLPARRAAIMDPGVVLRRS
jgi:putative ABC transport system permease protein